MNSYRYRPCVSTLQVRVLTRYLHVIFASRCGNLRGRGKPQTARRAPRTHNKRSARPANRPQTARRAPRTRSERGAGPASRPQASRGREPNGPLPNFTRRSCFFKASLRRRSYYMNRSLSLSFTDRALPSAIRPSEVSHSRLARGARGSRPRPADSQDAVFPSAPLCRPVSHPGTAKPIAGSPSPHRRGPPRFPTAAVLRLGRETARRKSARRDRTRRSLRQRSHPAALAARQNPYANRSAATTASRRVRTSVARPGLPPLAATALPHSAASAPREVVALALPCR